jgi:hypothetical protein
MSAIRLDPIYVARIPAAPFAGRRTFSICRFNDLIRCWTNPPRRTFHSSRRSVGEGGTDPWHANLPGRSLVRRLEPLDCRSPCAKAGWRRRHAAIAPACNGADGISDIEGKVTRVGASECGQRASFNRDRESGGRTALVVRRCLVVATRAALLIGSSLTMDEP